MTSPTLILHQYAESPFSEKVRLMLGYKRLAWRAVTVPAVPPKPDAVALTGGYRRTPFLQIGADIYCDTALISDVLEHLQPEPALFPPHLKGVARVFAQWADSTLFWAAMAYNLQPRGAQELFAALPPAMGQAFAEDRRAMRTGMLQHRLPEATAAYRSYLRRIAHMVEEHRFLFGDAPCVADFAAYHGLWFTRHAVPVLAGEHVASAGFKVDNGSVAAALADGQPSVAWTSTLDKGETLSLVAPPIDARAEVWQVGVGPGWHLDFSGVPAVAPEDAEANEPRVFEFHPLPGETLTLRITRPAAVQGATRAIDVGVVVAVAFDHVPPGGAVARGNVLAGRQVGRAVDGDAVRIPQHLEAPEPQVPGEADRLVVDALHQATVAGNNPSVVIDQRVAVCGVEVPLGDRHADRHRQPLPERAGGALNAGDEEVLRVPGAHAAELAEVADVVDRRRCVAREVQQAVDQHRPVPGAEHEAVAVGPVGGLRIELEIFRPEHGRDIGHAHRHARVSRVGRLHRVHRQGADGVGHRRQAGGVETHCRQAP